MTSKARFTGAGSVQKASGRTGSRKLRTTPSLLENLEPRVLMSAVKPGKRLMHPFFVVQPPTPDAVATISGLKPAQMRQAYGIDQVLFGSVVGNGAGQTVAIVDAYDAPNIINDAKVFSSTFGLPAPNLTVINQLGGSKRPGTDPAGPGFSWAVEISLDVEWVHAIAPMAKIVLVEANSNSWANLFTAIKTARNYPGVSAVSMSFGGDESANDALNNTVFNTPSGHNGVTFLASSGDNGAFSPNTGAKTVSYPAASPNVVSVGGTLLTLNTDNSYKTESAWGTGGTSVNGGGGGGISKYQVFPAYQNNVVTQTAAKRALPDVSMDADPSSGVAVYDSWDTPTAPWMVVGGTSLACPMWAGVIAITNQGRALSNLPTLDGPSQTLPKLYSLPAGDFHDIIKGSNGFPAGPGYDLATGIGTPIVNKVVVDLIDKPTIGSFNATPSSIVSGTAVTLAANNVLANGGNAAITSVKFYLESNGTTGFQTTDTLLGVGVQNGSNWTLNMTTNGFAAGAYTIYAVATDIKNVASLPSATALTVVAPVIDGFTLVPSPVNPGAGVILTASNVTEAAGGTVASVKFYQESNGTTGFQPADTLVGSGSQNGTNWTFALDTSSIAPGTYTYYAVATDAAGIASSAKSGTLAVFPDSASNNAFANAAVLTGISATVNSTNVHATREPGEPIIAGNPGGESVWWAWTAPSDGIVTINTQGSSFDTLLGVYTGASVSTLTLVADNNDQAFHNPVSSVTFRAVPGTTYYIAVDGLNGASGNIVLNLNEIVPASNDAFASPLVLTGTSASVTGSNIAATREVNEPIITGNTGGSSLWYSWTAPSDGLVTISTAGSNFNTLLGVYTGSSLAGLTQVAANDDLSNATWTSSVAFSVSSGVTYRISVDGFNGQTGSIALALLLVPASS